MTSTPIVTQAITEAAMDATEAAVIEVGKWEGLCQKQKGNAGSAENRWASIQLEGAK